MFLFGIGLAAMEQYGNCIISSFGFTYQSDFVEFYVFYSIWLEIPDFILRLGINWNLRRHEYQADAYAVENGYGPQLKKGLVIMFIKNEDHLSPDDLHTMINKTHPNINQRLAALDKLMGTENNVASPNRSQLAKSYHSNTTVNSSQADLLEEDHDLEEQKE